MVDFEVKDFSRDDWAGATAGLEGHCLVQSWEYGEAKARTGPWRVERGLLRDGDRTVGAVQTLVRPLPCGLRGGLAWINRGPLAAPGPTRRLVPMLEALRRHYADGRGLYLRIAPPVADGTLSGSDSEAAGLEAAGTPGWASAELDLGPSAEELRANLRSNWRNALAKAERSALAVRAGEDAGLFAEFLSAYRQFLETRGFATTVTPELLAAIQDLLPAGNRLCVFLADLEGAAVGSALIAIAGDRAEYLAGHVENAGRNLGAGQLVLWRAVAAMKERGLAAFDLGGMDPDLTPPGIYAFKEGLGGEPYRLAAELEAGGGGVIGRLVRWRVAGARAAA